MSWRRVRLGEICTIEKGNIGITKAVAGEYPLEPISKLIFDKMLYERGLVICPYSIRHSIRMCLLGNYPIAFGRESNLCCLSPSHAYADAASSEEMSEVAHRLILEN